MTNSKIIQEQGKIKAIKSLLKFKAIPLRNKLLGLRTKLKSGVITKDEFAKKYKDLEKIARNTYNSTVANYGYLQYQVDPAHVGQTLTKMLNFIH